jgi:anti-sigma B factor antagonist
VEIKESKVGDFAVLEPVGRLDSKSSPELEKKILELLGAGQRRFVVDFTGIEFLSSAGLRVLLMLAKKLSGADGWLALSALNDRVMEVFDIAGFSSVFNIRKTAAEAIAAAPVPGAAGERAAEDAAKALGVSRERMSRPSVSDEVAEIAKRAAVLLGVKLEPAAPAKPAKR